MQEYNGSKRLTALKSRESVWGGFKQEGGNAARVMPRRDLEKSEDRVEIRGAQISVCRASHGSGEYPALL